LDNSFRAIAYLGVGEQSSNRLHGLSKHARRMMPSQRRS